MDDMAPWIVNGSFGGGGDGGERPPHSAVTLESRSEGDLPYPVAFLHPAFGLCVGELIPQGATGGVPKSVQSHSRRLHVPL